jgi:integrase
MGVWLTEKVVRDLPLPEQGIKITYDAADPKGKQGWTIGFGVRASAGGNKAFVLRYRSSRTRSERVYTIGSWPVWSVEAARVEARSLKHAIEKGDDPQQAKQAARDAATVADLCERFVAEYLPQKREATRRDYTNIIGRDIKPALGRKLVATVEHADVEKLHRDIGKRGAPYAANRVAAVLSRLMTLAVKWRMRPDNPVKGLERNTEQKRRRYLSRDELARLTLALAEHPDQQAADILRLCLLTGCRRGEAQQARWPDIDLAGGKWTKPGATTKTKTAHQVPLSKPARQLLADLRARRGDSALVFPSRITGGPRRELKKNWAAICKTAGITGLRMHDLRHSFASELVSSGHSLAVIGDLLGHTQVATTARYSHLFDDVAREAVDSVGAVMAGLVAKPGKARKLKAVQGGKR